MQIDGACHCGFIAFEAEIDPAGARICHCTDCQTLSGSAFRFNVPTSEGSFRLTSGTPKEYVKVAESGRRRIQAFCPECGSSLYSAPEGPDPKVYMLRVGTIRQRDQLKPTAQIWWRSALPWARTVLGDMHHVETSR
jgi:hypothetical protein